MDIFTWMIDVLFFISILRVFVHTGECKKNLGRLCKLVKKDGTPLFNGCNDKKMFPRQRRDVGDPGLTTSVSGTLQHISTTPVALPQSTPTWTIISPSPSNSQGITVYPTPTMNNGPVGSIPGSFPGSTGSMPPVNLPDGIDLSKLKMYTNWSIILRPSDIVWLPFPSASCQEFHNPVSICNDSCPGNVTQFGVDFVSRDKHFYANITWSPPLREHLCTGYFVWWSPIKKGAPYDESLTNMRCEKVPKDTFNYTIENSTTGWAPDDKLLVLVKALPTSSSMQIHGAGRFDPKIKECFDPVPENPHVYFNFTQSIPPFMANDSTAEAACKTGYYLWMSAVWRCTVTRYEETYWNKYGVEPLCLTKKSFTDKCRKERNAPVEVVGDKLKCGEHESSVAVSVILGIISGVLLLIILAMVQYHRYMERRATRSVEETGISNVVLEGYCWVLYHPDNRKFVDEVWRFTTWLRKSGFNAVMDKMNTDRLQLGPARWCEIQMAKATKLLVLCSRGFLRMCNLDTTVDFSPENLTADEKMSLNQISLVRQALFDSGGRSVKIIPILVQDCRENELPPFLRTLMVYRWPEDHDSLLCRIVDNPEYAI